MKLWKTGAAQILVDGNREDFILQAFRLARKYCAREWIYFIRL
ncbi:MAG: hypothetical protein ACLUOI_17400 [Eisenbergiella sp.]